jgi:hypothetical protein
LFILEDLKTPKGHFEINRPSQQQENSPGRTSQNKSQIPSNSSVVADTMQSLSSVMRVRPQKLTVNNTSIDEQKRHENTNSASEVVLIKIKTNLCLCIGKNVLLVCIKGQ